MLKCHFVDFCVQTHYFVFLRLFLNICWTSLKLRTVKVDKGLLRDRYFLRTILKLYFLVLRTRKTHIYTNFHNFVQNYFLCERFDFLSTVTG